MYMNNDGQPGPRWRAQVKYFRILCGDVCGRQCHGLPFLYKYLIGLLFHESSLQENYGTCFREVPWSGKNDKMEA